MPPRQHAEAVVHITGEKPPPSLRGRIQRHGRKFARRAVIACAGALAIASAAGGGDLLGQARADNPQCVANAADPCPPVLDESANSVNQPRLQATNPHRKHVFCQPTVKVGAFCYRR